MRRSGSALCAITILVWLSGAVHSMAQDDVPVKRPFRRDSFGGVINNSASELYASTIMQIVPTISRNYHFKEIPETALAGRALLGLYRAGALTAPEALVRDPDHYLKRVPGSTLVEKLKHAREAVGDVATLRGERGIHASMQAVFRELDIFSNYSEVDYNTRRIYEMGAGIGLFLEDKPLGGSYFVRNIEIESPAHKQGIRPGDELLEVDRLPIAPNTTTAQLNAMMTVSARKRTGVKLTVRTLQGEKKIIEISSIRESIDNGDLIILSGESDRETPVLGYRPVGEGDWDYWVDRTNRIALIRLGTIQLSISKFHEIINQLQEDGLKGLILDLRDCPSGYPDTSADLAGLFLEKNKLIAKTDYRNPASDDRVENKKEFRAKEIDGKRCLDVPLTVLIGPDTSGAAELIAAALQDHERAKLVGQRSRGKSTIQQPNREQGRIQYSYRLTVGVFMRPNGKNLHRMPGATVDDEWGVRPDVEVVLPAQMRRQVRAWWFEQDTRPIDSLDPTRIDDIKNDPVLDTAVKLLKK